ncbi:MAG TPA: hypothetical protein VD867_16225, partial [Burkholderiales bacterium]|nr:hypothetical protein [Burkholderiales bacterium]
MKTYFSPALQFELNRGQSPTIQLETATKHQPGYPARFFVGVARSAPRRRAAPSLGANLPFRPKVGFHFRTNSAALAFVAALVPLDAAMAQAFPSKAVRLV